MTNMARTYLHPLPVELILDAQPMRVASGGVYRLAIAISFAYWASGCMDLPTEEIAVANLARCTTKALHDAGPALTTALSHILPALKIAYDALESRRQCRVDLAYKMISVKYGRKFARKTAERKSDIELLPQRKDKPGKPDATDRLAYDPAHTNYIPIPAAPKPSFAAAPDGYTGHRRAANQPRSKPTAATGTPPAAPQGFSD
jgi:hypothetical protein